jgi:chromosome segregation ATPase
MRIVWITALIAVSLRLLALILRKVYQHRRRQYVAETDGKIAAAMSHIRDVEHQIEIYEIELIGLPEDYATKARADYKQLKNKLHTLRKQLLDLQDSVYRG